MRLLSQTRVSRCVRMDDRRVIVCVWPIFAAVCALITAFGWVMTMHTFQDDVQTKLLHGRILSMMYMSQPDMLNPMYWIEMARSIDTMQGFIKTSIVYILRTICYALYIVYLIPCNTHYVLCS